jgi:hypothetical protein
MKKATKQETLNYLFDYIQKQLDSTGRKRAIYTKVLSIKKPILKATWDKERASDEKTIPTHYAKKLKVKAPKKRKGKK